MNQIIKYNITVLINTVISHHLFFFGCCSFRSAFYRVIYPVPETIANILSGKCLPCALRQKLFLTFFIFHLAFPENQRIFT